MGFEVFLLLVGSVGLSLLLVGSVGLSYTDVSDKYHAFQLFSEELIQ